MPNYNLDLATPFGKLIINFLYDQRPTKSLSWLSRELGLSRTATSLWIYGRSAPRAATLVRLAQLMRSCGSTISLDELFATAGASLPDPWLALRKRVAEDELLPIAGRDALLRTIDDLAHKHSVESERA